jgi:hypothetical protein
MTWVLIFFMYHHGAISQEFNTEAACREAYDTVHKQRGEGYGGCFEKGKLQF